MPTTNTLNWTPNTEPDVAKYNIYRKIGAAPTRIAADLYASVPVGTTTFVDTVTVDGDYFYAITAVDTANNQSPLSAVKDKIVDLVPPQAPTGLTVV